MSTNWIQTYTGKKVYPFGPFGPDDVDIRDIAHALAYTCRWGGHCREFYSVAEHSMYVSKLVPDDLALDALLHDAPEAYLGDIPTPLKELLPKIGEAEDRIMVAIAKKFNLSYPQFEGGVSEVDKMLQICEVEQLMSNLEMFRNYRWGVEHSREPVNVTISGFHPKFAEQLFLQRFRTLTYDPILFA